MLQMFGTFLGHTEPGTMDSVRPKSQSLIFKLRSRTTFRLWAECASGHFSQAIPRVTRLPFIDSSHLRICYYVRHVTSRLQVSMDNDGILRVQVDYSFCQLQTPQWDSRILQPRRALPDIQNSKNVSDKLSTACFDHLGHQHVCAMK